MQPSRLRRAADLVRLGGVKLGRAGCRVERLWPLTRTLAGRGGRGYARANDAPPFVSPERNCRCASNRGVLIDRPIGGRPCSARPPTSDRTPWSGTYRLVRGVYRAQHVHRRVTDSIFRCAKKSVCHCLVHDRDLTAYMGDRGTRAGGRGSLGAGPRGTPYPEGFLESDVVRGTVRVEAASRVDIEGEESDAGSSFARAYDGRVRGGIELKRTSLESTLHYRCTPR